MEPLAVDIRLIRAVLAPELKIVPGRALMARVVSVAGPGRGALSLAGMLLDAKLPEHVKAGDELRLVVRHVSSDRVVLGLADQQQQLPVPPPPLAVPLPGGGSLRVSEQEEAARSRQSATDSSTLTLRYDAPALGALDLRFELDPQSLRVSVAVPSGSSLELAKDAAAELRQRLGETVERTITVNVSARHEPLDLYA